MLKFQTKIVPPISVTSTEKINKVIKHTSKRLIFGLRGKIVQTLNFKYLKSKKMKHVRKASSTLDFFLRFFVLSFYVFYLTEWGN